MKVKKYIGALSLPKEHGAWGILLGSFSTVVAFTNHVTSAMFLFLMSVISFYLSRHLLLILLKKKTSRTDYTWFAIFVFAGWMLLISSAILASCWRIIFFSMILPLFLLIEILLIQVKKQRSFFAQIIGTIGLTSIAPLSYILLLQKTNFQVGIFWIINTLFFSSGILFVRFQIARLKMKAPQDSEYRRYRFILIRYHFLLSIFLIWVSLAVDSYSGLIIAFIPVFIQTLMGLMNRFQVSSIRKLGWLQISQATIFVLLLAFLF